MQGANEDFLKQERVSNNASMFRDNPLYDRQLKPSSLLCSSIFIVSFVALHPVF